MGEMMIIKQLWDILTILGQLVLIGFLLMLVAGIMIILAVVITAGVRVSINNRKGKKK
nr:MAG TPA: hypothetical protein [Caudoviricetes sp.]